MCLTWALLRDVTRRSTLTLTLTQPLTLNLKLAWVFGLDVHDGLRRAVFVDSLRVPHGAHHLRRIRAVLHRLSVQLSKRVFVQISRRKEHSCL